MNKETLHRKGAEDAKFRKGGLKGNGGRAFDGADSLNFSAAIDLSPVFFAFLGAFASLR